ncbi:HIT family protein [Paenibacillus sp. IHB B 3415]|uniref:HIT family protein n=1 Tax=Paenibacillus sp. IHB B 3415 TaxID=867080 RepID=UPI00062E5EF1|nr:HIT domain-containing protein [Paenibacillus sp. IHB B 3415]
MTEDFYCDEVFSGKTVVQKVLETDNVLAYHHTRPFYPVHIVAIPKRHISSLMTLQDSDNDDLLLELIGVIKQVQAAAACSAINIEEPVNCRL